MMQTITWQSPSNIALVKYWGKKGNQLPTNPSISFTLNKAFTQTTVSFEKVPDPRESGITFQFDGTPNAKFEQRIREFIAKISPLVPVLEQLQLVIESKNTFPHSSGIASSASAMSALALCLVSIEKEVTGSISHVPDFFQKASVLARIGSGSASRSVYGGFVIWGEMQNQSAFSNEYAMPINQNVHPIFKTYNDAILLVSGHEKKVSSSVGHGLMNHHPFAEAKFAQSFKNAQRMLDILKNGEQSDFADLTESEALSLHAMMMTSSPSYLLMEPNTLAIIQKIRQFRADTGIQACFTLDAGANVHFIYPDANKPQVIEFINSALLTLCQNQKWIDDGVGAGPKEL